MQSTGVAPSQCLVSKCMVELYGLIIDRPELSLAHITSYLNFTG